MNIDPEPVSIPGSHRALAAIVFTDIVGFSKRMSHNERDTLKACQRDLDLMRALCKAGKGEVLKSTGDGLLMHFPSAVDAVRCAMKIQQRVTDAAATLPPGEALQHRIGIHVGDVYFSADDVMGDGVNIAARLQEQAEPGGIAISSTVYDLVKGRVELKTTALGPRELKNIKDQVLIYRILASAAAEPSAETATKASVAGASSSSSLSPPPQPSAKSIRVAPNQPAPGAPGAPSAAATAPPARPSKGVIVAVAAVVVLAVLALLVLPSLRSRGKDGDASVAKDGASKDSSAKDAAASKDAGVKTPATAAQIVAARREFAGKYDFQGMLNWMAEHNVQDPELTSRFTRLAALRQTFDKALEGTSREKPIAGQRGREAWLEPDGRIGQRRAGEVTVEAVDQMGKQEMVSLLMFVCRNGDDTITPAFRDAMLLFGDEYQLTGAIMNRLREGSGKSTPEKDKDKDKATP